MILLLVVSGVLAACAPRWLAPRSFPMGGSDGRGYFGQRFASNGEQIYFTAANQDGVRIAYTGGPNSGGMMMGNTGLTCASCHDSDGRGGLHYMHMWEMNAPDIRYSALIADEEHDEVVDDHHGEALNSQDHGDGYDLETFRMAVVEGNHPNGEPMDSDMPRWQLSDADLEDLLAFLKTLE